MTACVAVGGFGFATGGGAIATFGLDAVVSAFGFDDVEATTRGALGADALAFAAAWAAARAAGSFLIAARLAAPALIEAAVACGFSVVVVAMPSFLTIVSEPGPCAAGIGFDDVVRLVAFRIVLVIVVVLVPLPQCVSVYHSTSDPL
jgi:hypothetical protein